MTWRPRERVLHQRCLFCCHCFIFLPPFFPLLLGWVWFQGQGHGCRNNVQRAEAIFFSWWSHAGIAWLLLVHHLCCCQFLELEECVNLIHLMDFYCSVTRLIVLFFFLKKRGGGGLSFKSTICMKKHEFHGESQQRWFSMFVEINKLSLPWHGQSFYEMHSCKSTGFFLPWKIALKRKKRFYRVIRWCYHTTDVQRVSSASSSGLLLIALPVINPSGTVGVALTSSPLLNIQWGMSGDSEGLHLYTWKQLHPHLAR